MKLIRTIISLAVIMLVIAACSRDAQHGVESEVKDDDKNGIGMASDNDDEADTSARNDTLSTGNDHKELNTRQGQADADFLIAAADGGLLEVQLGELARQNASSADVKEFARTMTIDHGKANEELKSLADKLRINVPGVLSEKNQEKYNELSQKKGKEFDNAYSKMMVADHQETIDKFRAESNNGQQHEIRTWAEAKLPNLQHHLEMAQKINNGGNGTSKGQ